MQDIGNCGSFVPLWTSATANSSQKRKPTATVDVFQRPSVSKHKHIELYIKNHQLACISDEQAGEHPYTPTVINFKSTPINELEILATQHLLNTCMCSQARGECDRLQ